MRQIRRFAWQKKLNYRKLLSTLFLSGAEFDSPDIKRKHAEKLGVPIMPEDLLTQISFKRALAKAAEALQTFETKKKLRLAGTADESGQAKKKMAAEAPTADMLKKRAEREAKRRRPPS